jgi:hypothetical protein
MQFLSEKRTELYLNTVREYRRKKLHMAPRRGPQQNVFCWGKSATEQARLCRG